MRKVLLIFLVMFVGVAFCIGAPEVTAPAEPISENYGFERLHPRDSKFVIPEGWTFIIKMVPGTPKVDSGEVIIWKRKAGTGTELKSQGTRINLKVIKK